MSTEANKALVRSFLEGAWNRGDMAIIEKTLSPDYITHESLAAGHPPGPELYKQTVSQYRTAFPDLHTTIEDLIAEGDQVVVRGTDRFTRSSEMQGMPATRQQVTVSWIGIYRIVGSQIVEQWLHSETSPA